jgi:hypothetical protein
MPYSDAKPPSLGFTPDFCFTPVLPVHEWAFVTFTSAEKGQSTSEVAAARGLSTVYGSGCIALRPRDGAMFKRRHSACLRGYFVTRGKTETARVCVNFTYVFSIMP